jgi:hypothetical protein
MREKVPVSANRICSVILDRLYNFHWIEQGEAARAAQAYAGFLSSLLRAHRIQAVINLRGNNPGHLWWKYETGVCRKLGVVHRDAKLNSRQLPSQCMLIDLVDGFDNVPRPFLVKCSGGQDRTAFAAALYVLHRHGWCALGRAERQFALWPYLHFPRREQRWLKLFPAFANETSAGQPLRAWLEQYYSASAFATWLRASGQSRSFEGLYGVPAGTKA